MALTNKPKKQRIFLSVAHGKINQKHQDGTVDSFTDLDGRITAISQKTVNFGKGEETFVEITVTDNGQDYVLSFNKSSHQFRQVIAKLASDKDFPSKVITFTVWENKDGYTQVSMHADGVKMMKPEKLEYPKLEYVTIAGKDVPNPEKRDAYVEKVLSRVVKYFNDYMTDQAKEQEAMADIPDDLPEDMPEECMQQKPIAPAAAPADPADDDW